MPVLQCALEPAGRSCSVNAVLEHRLHARFVGSLVETPRRQNIVDRHMLHGRKLLLADRNGLHVVIGVVVFESDHGEGESEFEEGEEKPDDGVFQDEVGDEEGQAGAVEEHEAVGHVLCGATLDNVHDLKCGCIFCRLEMGCDNIWQVKKAGKKMAILGQSSTM